MINALFAKEMDCDSESSVLNICRWLKKTDITLSNIIVACKLAKRKIARPDVEFALPILFIPRQLKRDVCIFTGTVLECVILTYSLIETGTECDKTDVLLSLFM